MSRCNLVVRKIITFIIMLAVVYPAAGVANCIDQLCVDLKVQTLSGDALEAMERFPSAGPLAKKVRSGFESCDDVKASSPACPVADEKVLKDVIVARDSLDLLGESGKKFRDFLAQGDRKETQSQEALSYQKDISLVMDYIKKQGGAKCFPGGVEAYQNFCLATKWKDLTLIPENSTSTRSLILKNKDGSYFQLLFKWHWQKIPNTNPPQFYPNPKFSIRQSWLLKKQGSTDTLGTVSSVGTMKGADLFDLKNSTISIGQMHFKETTKDHYGSEIKDFNSGMHDETFTLDQLKAPSSNPCEDFPLDPREFYELALKKDKSISLSNADVSWTNTTAAAQYLAYGSSAGLAETTQNYIDSGKGIYEGMVGLKNLVLNNPVPFCQQGEAQETPPIECEGAIRCQKPEDGKWCIGTKDLLFKALGDKKKEILEACKNVNGTYWLECLEVEVGTRVGKAAWKMMVECSNDVARCSAQIATLSASVLATMGTGVVVNTLGKGMLTTLTVLLRGGQITIKTAKVLATATKLAVSGTNFTADMLLGGMPVDAQTLVMSEIKSILANGAKGLTAAEKEIFEKVVADAAKKTTKVAANEGEKVSEKVTEDAAKVATGEAAKSVSAEAAKSADVVGASPVLTAVETPKKTIEAVKAPTESSQVGLRAVANNSKEVREAALVKKKGQAYVDELKANAAIKDPAVRMRKIEDALQDIKGADGQSVKIDNELQKTLDGIHKQGIVLETDLETLQWKIDAAQAAIEAKTGVNVPRPVIKDRLIKKGLLGEFKSKIEDSGIAAVDSNSVIVQSKKIVNELEKAVETKGARNATSSEIDRIQSLANGHSDLVDQAKFLEKIKEELLDTSLSAEARSALKAKLTRQTDKFVDQAKQLDHYMFVEQKGRLDLNAVEAQAKSNLHASRNVTTKNVSEGGLEYKKLRGESHAAIDGEVKFKSEKDKKDFLDAHEVQMQAASKKMVESVSQHVDNINNQFSQYSTNMAGGDAGKGHLLREQIEKAREQMKKIKERMAREKEHFGLTDQDMEILEQFAAY